MTIWALIIALVVGVTYVIPIGTTGTSALVESIAYVRLGMIQAVTNRQIGLNVITELIVGFMIPGRPTAMMMCVSLSLKFLSEL